MTYEKDSTILAADFNSFLGASGTSAYASQAAVDAAAPAVGAVYGIGYGNHGYGQTAITQAAVVAGDVIDSDEWTNMRNMLAVCSEQQDGAADSYIPPVAQLAVGELIEAHDFDSPSSDPFDFETRILNIDNNRFVLDATKATTVTIGGTSSDTRGSVWSTSIDHTINITFSDAQAARYFFNAGGELKITLSHPTGTAQDNDWNTVLASRLGVVTFNHTETSSSGSRALNSSIGYFDLTDSFQTIINGIDMGVGAGYAYESNDVVIEAKRTSTDTTNGANGTGVQIKITLTDGHTSAFFDQVAAGTAVAYTSKKSAFLTNPAIETPSGSLVDGF